MTVKELIRELQQYDPELEVRATHHTTHYTSREVATEIGNVELVELEHSTYIDGWIVPDEYDAADKVDGLIFRPKTKPNVVVLRPW